METLQVYLLSYFLNYGQSFNSKGTPIFVIADINECEEKNVCGDVARCENMMGMYDCICPKGYRYEEETKGCLGKKKTHLVTLCGYLVVVA